MTSPDARRLAITGVVLVAAFTVSGCSTKPASETQPAEKKPALIGEITPVVSVKELMESMIDPIADNIFEAVWWDNTAKGVVEHRPTTDEDWEKVKVGAVTMVEGIELLKVPRPWTPPGDVNNSTGPNPPELSPTQMQAKLDKDPVLWTAKIQALRNVGLEVLEIVKKKDANALWQAGGDLDDACEGCHLEYWYPGDRATVEAEKKFKARIDKPATAGKPAK
jgi:hypothetical protein